MERAKGVGHGIIISLPPYQPWFAGPWPLQPFDLRMDRIDT
jgi:hypothetical protein